MTEAALGQRTKLRGGLEATALEGAIRFWFVVMLIGQGVFLYYIVAFYAPGAFSGDLASWNRHPMAGPLYVPGDIWGNVAFGAHVALALIIGVGGMMQLVPHIRARAPALHRWSGRAFIVSAMLASLAGLYMVWFREDSNGEITDDIIISINGVLILAFCALAWREAARRNIVSHRRWALRAFMVTNGVFFLRLGFSAWVVLTQSRPDALTFYIFSAACYLVPWAVTELYLAAKESGGPAKLSMAGLVTFASLYLAVGVFGFVMIFVRTILAA